MLSFQFYNPTRIIFGKETISALPEYLPKKSKILVLYGGGSVIKNGTLGEVKQALAGYSYVEFKGIEANPHFETLMKAVVLIKEQNIDFLLAVGGGSVLDGTKFIAAACCYDGDAWDILTTKGSCITQAMPFGTVLTLPATGSEMNNGGVITRATTKEKLAFSSSYTFPQFSIMDPTKTYTLPKRQLANGIADTFVHVFEQYMTYPIDAKVPDSFSEGVLRTLIDIAPDVMNKTDDYDSRANFMWAATVGLNGFLATGVPQDWTTHRIGHEITALFGLDHAQTLVIILPALLKVRREAKKAKLLQYAREVLRLKESDHEQMVDAARAQIVSFFIFLGMKTKLSDYGITAKDLDAVLDALVKHNQVQMGEKGDISIDVSRQILEAAL